MQVTRVNATTINQNIDLGIKSVKTQTCPLKNIPFAEKSKVENIQFTDKKGIAIIRNYGQYIPEI